MDHNVEESKRTRKPLEKDRNKGLDSWQTALLRMNILCVCAWVQECAPCVCIAQGVQKRAPDSLEAELQEGWELPEVDAMSSRQKVFLISESSL